jgi:hypothetical protein
VQNYEENHSGVDQFSFDITDKMAEFVKTKGITLFKRGEPEDTSKRAFMKAGAAFAAWSILPKSTKAAPLPHELEMILRHGDFIGAVGYISETSDFPAYRKLAKHLLTLLPDNITLTTVHKHPLQGETILDRQNLSIEIILRDKTHGYSVNGMDESTVLHEAIHAAIRSRYDLINIYAAQANKGKWGTRSADEALQEYIKVWKEFRTTVDNEHVDGQVKPYWLEAAYGDPDEFIAYSLTEPEMQVWLQDHKYSGITLWEKLRDFFKIILGIDNANPSWLDAALHTSNNVLSEAQKDKPNYSVSMALSKKVSGKGVEQLKRAVLFKKGDTPQDYNQLNIEFREKHKTIWGKAKKFLQQHLAPGGLLEKSVFQAKIERDSEFAVVEFEVTHLVGELERAIKKDYKMDPLDLPARTQELLNEVMAGNIATDVPKETEKVLVAMRQHIDSYSKQYIKALEGEIQDMAQMLRDMKVNIKRGDESTIRDLAVKVDLLHTIQANIGHYIHRSYKAFDDPSWYKNAPEEDVNAARTYLRERLTNQGVKQAEANKRAEVVLHEIVKNGTAYDSMEAFIRESKLGAKDLSILKKRQNIAPEIRKLLGEYKDPRVNFSKSITKMGRLIFNQKFLEKVRENGVGVFMWTEHDRPPEATVQLAADSSEVMAPLNGLWVTPETDKSFKDALGKENMANWYKFIVKTNGLVKYGKTVLSPTTAARNWISAAFFSIANGHFNWKHMSKSFGAMNEYFRQMGSKEKLDYLKRLKKLGVVYDTPFAGEMIRLLADTEVMGSLAGHSKAKLTARKFFGMATKFYQFGDDFWKIIGFENEKTRWLKNGKTLEEAEKISAERIRNTYPTYSMVGSAIQSLRRFPLAGTFVSFPAEIIRTSFNMFRYTIEDLKTPGRESMARQRMLGLGIASSFAWALQAISMAALGIDDDEEEAVRIMGAPWNRNSNLVFMGYDEDGNIVYFDVSFMDPYNQWKRIWTAIWRGQPLDQKFKEIVWDEGLTPFLGTDIMAGTLWEVFSNKKESGGKVFRERDEIDKQVVDITSHLWRTIQPGIVSNVTRTMKAINGETSRSGRKYKLFDEGISWIGFRRTTLDPKVALYYKSFAFTDTKRDANSNITDVVKDPDEDIDKDDLRLALKVAARIRATGYHEMHLLVKAAMRTGLNRNDVIRILRNSNITKRDVIAILDDTVPPWKPNVASVKGQAKKARTVFGREGTDRVIERYKELLELSKENR